MPVAIATILVSLVSGFVQAADKVAPPPPPSFLRMLAVSHTTLAPMERGYREAIARRDWPAVEAACRRMIEAAPFMMTLHYNLGCVLALQGRSDEAFAALFKSVELGFSDEAHIRQDPDIESLRKDPRFEELLAKAARVQEAVLAPVAPWMITNTVARVEESNVARLPRLPVPVAIYSFGTNPALASVVSALRPEVDERLNAWYRDGTAAGNWGDLYDNRDNGHSRLMPDAFPQLTFIEYSDMARDAGLHLNMALRIWHKAGPVIGNASLARTGGAFWRSLPRMAYVDQAGAVLLYLQYVSNILYIHPCHVDHLSLSVDHGYGDVFPANTPFLLISQGSSGSDRPFLEAVAATLAAFHPDTKRRLTETGTMMPTVQLILRSHLQGIADAEGYLTGAAHPVVFDSARLDLPRMIDFAHSLRSDALPPMVQLKVVEEDHAVQGQDYFSPFPNERIFDTPCAVARIARSTRFRRRMVLNAEASQDLDGRPLSFHWKVLQGDPQKITLRRLNATGSIVEALVDYHPPRSILTAGGIESSRVDIGAFVHNGLHYSAPGIVSIYYPPNEEREYAPDGRILRVTYFDDLSKARYADPALVAAGAWTDEYHYDDGGRLTGWTRSRAGVSEQFTREGRLILEVGANGQPIRTAAVRYGATAVTGEDKAPRLTQETLP